MTPSNDTPAAPVGSQDNAVAYRYFKGRSGELWRVRKGFVAKYSIGGGPWTLGPSVTLDMLLSDPDCLETDAHGTPLAEAPETPAPAAGASEGFFEHFKAQLDSMLAATSDEEIVEIFRKMGVGVVLARKPAEQPPSEGASPREWTIAVDPREDGKDWYPVLGNDEGWWRKQGHEIVHVREITSNDEACRLREALLAAMQWIHAAPHGDNCHLTNDPPEFDRCMCSKDSILELEERLYEDGILKSPTSNDHE